MAALSKSTPSSSKTLFLTIIGQPQQRLLISATLTALCSIYFASKKRSGSKKEKRGKNDLKPNSNAPLPSEKNKKSKRTGKKQNSSILKVLSMALQVREKWTLAGLTTSLILRSLISIFMAQHLGKTLGYFCDRKWGDVVSSVNQFAAVSVFAAMVNASLKTFADMFEHNLREVLTRKAHSLYLNDKQYYRVNWLDNVEQVDQLICEDISKWAAATSEVYTQSLKPLIDMVLFSYQLKRKMGLEGPYLLYAWFAIAASLSTVVLPRFGKLAAIEQTLEGRFRERHARIKKNAEMVAFTRGEKPEKALLDKAFNTIRDHQLSVLPRKFFSDSVQQYLTKYFATVVGFSLTVRPVLMDYNGMGSATAGEIAAFFVSSRSTLEGLANAVLALFELQKRVGTLSGLSYRVENLFKSLKMPLPLLEDQIKQASDNGNPAKRIVNENSGLLRFSNVDVHEPNGRKLLSNLNVTIEQGMRVIITGDNGCGKSSLFRVICGLWPIVSGTVEHPPANELFFLSQTNFVPVGTLREVLVYPRVLKQSKELDDHLWKILEWSHMLEDSLDPQSADGKSKRLAVRGLKRGATMDDQLDWNRALSPGQQQRFAFARLFFSANPFPSATSGKTRIAVIDEATNGIAPNIEADLYERCHKLGLSVFSISHKVELKSLHDYELHYHANKEGSWDWIPLR
mmetsp:Transcript_13975/g.18291  ORF Transcript_13975/g.18291 Transcript_13975/m.18291 type:complete len:683 (+) Transcript_13975:199-2247(+)